MTITVVQCSHIQFALAAIEPSDWERIDSLTEIGESIIKKQIVETLNERCRSLAAASTGKGPTAWFRGREYLRSSLSCSGGEPSWARIPQGAYERGEDRVLAEDASREFEHGGVLRCARYRAPRGTYERCSHPREPAHSTWCRH